MRKGAGDGFSAVPKISPFEGVFGDFDRFGVRLVPICGDFERAQRCAVTAQGWPVETRKAPRIHRGTLGSGKMKRALPRDVDGSRLCGWLVLIAVQIVLGVGGFARRRYDLSQIRGSRTSRLVGRAFRHNDLQENIVPISGSLQGELIL